MDITVAEQRDNFARIDVAVVKSDYEEDYKKRLRNVAATATLRGFRKGHIPQALIVKMYGESIHLDAVSSAVNSKLADFIREKDFKIIGQPVLSEESDDEDKFKAEEMTLTFHLALKPTVEDSILSADDTLTYYRAALSDEDAAEQLTRYRKAHAKYADSDHIVPNAFISGSLAELDGDTPKEGGLQVDGTLVYPEFMTDEEEKAKFDAAPKDSIIIFNPYKAYGGKKSELKALFRLEEMTDEDAEKYRDSEFSYEIKEIGYSKEADLDQEFFDLIFDPGTVHSEEEALAEIRTTGEKNLKANADYKFAEDLISLIADHKIDRIELAEETLKVWYASLDVDGAPSEEKLQREFPEVVRAIKIDLIVNHFAEKYGLEVTEEDLRGFTRTYMANQLLQYGIPNPTDGMLEDQIDHALADDHFRYNARENMLRQMVAQKVREDGLVTVVEKEVTPEELRQVIQGKPEETPEEAAAEPAAEE